MHAAALWPSQTRPNRQVNCAGCRRFYWRDTRLRRRRRRQGLGAQAEGRRRSNDGSAPVWCNKDTGKDTGRSARLAEFGGAEEDRTPDLVIANDALSQLSYDPNDLRPGMLPASLLRPGLVEKAPRGSALRNIYRSLRLRAISNAPGRRDRGPWGDVQPCWCSRRHRCRLPRVLQICTGERRSKPRPFRRGVPPASDLGTPCPLSSSQAGHRSISPRRWSASRECRPARVSGSHRWRCPPEDRRSSCEAPEARHRSASEVQSFLRR